MAQKKQRVLQQIEITDYAAEGKSLARVDGKVIFVKGAMPGDIVDIQLTKNKKDWGEGHILRHHEYSSRRVDPFCQHFGLCGGCSWQMVPYEEQLVFKQQQVEDQLKRLGRISLPTIQPILGCKDITFYRNKLEFTFSNKKYLSSEEFRQREPGTAPEPALGYHVPKWFDKVIDINTCYLQADPSNQIRNFIRDLALENNFSFYDIRQHQGFLRNLIIRYATTGELMINLCVGEENKQALDLIFSALLANFPQITTLLYTLNTKLNDSIFDLEPVVVHGKGYIKEVLEDFTFKIGPKSFFQTNSRQGEELYKVTRNYAELTGSEVLYDLYCGTGSIGIFCSKHVKKLVGVEAISEAVSDAQINAELNNVKHAAFFDGDVIDICTDTFFNQHGNPDVVITDPPRAGMHEKLVRKLLEISAPTVVYVSCNPATQARDLQLLDEGYSVEKIQPVDMFPHTHHIENVVQLKRR
ncbi:MAG: 23S rRNA (uracil(1939)-C(5))-methyltransferase RlmD [Chitinophagaceae bacterium]